MITGKCPFIATDTINATYSKTNNLLSQDIDLTAVMNTVLDGLIIIDSVGIIQAFNPSAVRIFGYQPEEVMGRNIKMLMPEPYHSEHDSYLSNYLSSSNPKVIGIGREVTGRRKNGESFAMELGVNKMQSDPKIMFVGTVRDISDRKAVEKAMQSYILALKRSNQELDDFAYIASHDLKEPLRGLSNNALFLKEDYENILDERGIKRIDRIVYLSERMEQLINDLLYFSRIGNQDLAIRTTDLNILVHDILAIMDSMLHENHIKILIPEPLPTITCDSVRITEVFRNLITNAIKYNDKEEKIINIGYENKNDTMVFHIRDNGIGIEDKFFNDVFRIFKRLNEEDDSKKGTGVGLTFVKKIIERHGGSIWLESKLGEGTTFYFTIPEISIQ